MRKIEIFSFKFTWPYPRPNSNSGVLEATQIKWAIHRLCLFQIYKTFYSPQTGSSFPKATDKWLKPGFKIY